MALVGWLAGVGSPLNRLILGTTLWFWSGDMLHSGTHYALSCRPALSELMGWVAGWPFTLPHVWARQHVIWHHTKTNVAGMDPDLYHFDKYFKNHPPPFAWQKCRPFPIGLIAPLFTHLMPLLHLPTVILRQNTFDGMKTKCVWGPGEWRGAVVTYLSLLAGGLAVICAHGFLHFLTPSFVVGVLYYLMSQVSHINAQSFSDPRLGSGEWAVAQVCAAQGDYGYDSALWAKMSLGLNCQAVHHLFPNVHPCHYSALAKQLEPVFRKHGLPVPGFERGYCESLWQHLQYLHALNKSA
eukprot:NODE_1840_length_1052_cov_277.523571.p1 GENE.NODE_1840_length_1052_cov_277.523571~~NODE_1840_length_1052_cov_277.523571.p1  ORF type:complete len:296 (+),score=16.65 NODE_1840_length_1052_cov_277.523571:132-1019(+)